VTKIFRVPDGLIGFAGSGWLAMEVLEWFRKGRPANQFPEKQRDIEDNAGAIFIDAQGRCWGLHRSPHLELHHDRFDAIGAGRDYALAAMYLGHDARKAVEVACALDSSCGNGIDTLTLED
jgi:hypothetical protein